MAPQSIIDQTTLQNLIWTLTTASTTSTRARTIQAVQAKEKSVNKIDRLVYSGGKNTVVSAEDPNASIGQWQERNGTRAARALPLLRQRGTSVLTWKTLHWMRKNILL
jgi:hypothetical protein